MSRISALNARNRRFENALDRLENKGGEDLLTPAKRNERRQAADKDPMAFAKIYFPRIFHLPFNDLHRWIASRGPGRWTVDGHPESGKSAFAYINAIVRPIAYREGGIANINNGTIEDAERRTSGLVEAMRRNRLLCYDFDMKFYKTSQRHHKINNVDLIPGSVERGLRHLVDANFSRVNYQINDDLYNRISVRSVAWREKVNEFIVGEAWRQLDSHAAARSFTLANTIIEDSPITVVSKESDGHLSFPALNEKGESNWPEFRSAEEWDVIRKKTPIHVWLGEFMAQPALKGDVFDMDWFDDSRPGLVYVNDLKMLVRLAAHDAARGESPEACRKALITGSLWQAKARQIMLIEDIYSRQENYIAFFSYALQLLKRLPFSLLLFENDFNQWSFAKPYYDMWKTTPGNKLPIHHFLAKNMATKYFAADKDSRPLNLVMPVSTKEIVFEQGVLQTSGGKMLLLEAAGFPKEKKKDTLDAFASLYILADRFIRTGTLTPTKKSKRKWYRPKRFYK